MQKLLNKYSLLSWFRQYRTAVLLGYLVLIVLTLFVLSLAIWQWQRSVEKSQLLQKFAHNQQQPLMLDQLLHRRSFVQQLPEAEQRLAEQTLASHPLMVTGQLQPEQVWLLDNQQVNGHTGYDVLTLFAAETKAGASMLVINLGWVQSSYAKRHEPPEISLDTNTLQQWRLQLVFPRSSLNPFVRETADSLGRFIRVQTPQTVVEQLQKQFPHILYAVLLPKDDQISALKYTPTGFVFHYNNVVMRPEKHRAYAVQWLLLAVALLIIFSRALRQSSTIRERKK